MKNKETPALNLSEVRGAIEAWEKLKAKADDILAVEGNTTNDGILDIELDSSGKSVDISYWSRARGESYIEDDIVPIEWFGVKSIEDLRELWQKKRESDMRAMERAARAAERREKQRKAKQKELKKKRELATLKRLKEKYPEEA